MDTTTNPAADMQARFRPTDQQIAIARAMLAAEPAATSVIVGLALPGKQRGVWTAGQVVRPVPGFWLSDGGQTGPYAHSFAREAAIAAAEARLTGQGVAAYAVIDHALPHRAGTTPAEWSMTAAWGVFESHAVDHRPAAAREPATA